MDLMSDMGLRITPSFCLFEEFTVVFTKVIKTQVETRARGANEADVDM